MSIENKRSMLGSLKSFDVADHANYDDKGKNALMNFLNKKLENFETVANPNKYGIDLLTLNVYNKVTHCWEVEVRHGNWQGDIAFPFRDINCIERKDYQWRKDQELFDKIPFEMASDVKVTYVQLNKECTRAVFIDSTTILKYPLKPWANRKGSNEYVRQVPITETLQVKIA